MNRDVVQLIGQYCSGLEDGSHDVFIKGLLFPIYLNSLDIDNWITSSIGQTIFNDERKYGNLIDPRLLGEFTNDLEVCGSSSKDVLLKLCEKFGFPCVEVGAKSEVKLNWSTPEFCAHFFPVICVILKSDRFCKFVYYRQVQKLHPLRTLNLYPHQGVDPCSQAFKFIVYQFVYLFKVCSSKSLYPIFSIHNVLIDDNYWMSIALDQLLNAQSLNTFHHFDSLKPQKLVVYDESKLSDITKAWCERKLSNYEYLIRLNELAGRKRNNKLLHFVFPWVSDFTSPDGGYRPLNKTKYRLNKGDDQLSMQYSKQRPSYHVPELFSDICYFVYRARIEPKNVLSEHVRSQWVPEEYPTTIARLYEWTPDECIPEFYEDPSIFKSIHPDMSDLQLPEFTETPEQFIEWHKKVLESEEVSAHLHQWIDLIFGYLLTGKPAIQALNVHLSYIKLTNKERFIGPVQLFSTPHPRRTSQNKNEDDFSSNTLEDRWFEQTRHSSGFNDDDLSLTELLTKILTKSRKNPEYVDWSMMSVGVTILELALADCCRDLTPSAGFDARLERAKNLALTRTGLLPPFLRTPLKQLLVGGDPLQTISVLRFTRDSGTFFNLPNHLQAVHDCLAAYFNNDYLMTVAMKNNSGESEDHYFKGKLNTLWHAVEITNVGKLWLHLFVDLLNNKRTAVDACYTLFPRILRFYSKGDLMDVVERIKQLLDISTPHLMKLLDNQFFMALSMGYGTELFLEHFVPRLLEMLILARDNLYTAIKQLILWVARRYGAILTAKSVTSKLLCLLPLCFTNPDQRVLMGNIDSITAEVAGDQQCRNILNCLIEIGVMYGPVFITAQYLPFCADVYEQAKGRTTILQSWESAMIASSVLLKSIVDCLTDKQLMDQLEDVIVGKILFVSIRLFSSTSWLFTSADGRKLLAYKTMAAVHTIANRIGAENVERHMSYAIQKLFSTFSVIFELGDDNNVRALVNPPKQLDQVFTRNFAVILLHIFSFTCGRQYTFSIIQNKELILKLEQDAGVDCKPEIFDSRPMSKPIAIETAVPSTSFNSLSCSFPSGNRLAIFFEDSESANSRSLSCDASNQEAVVLCNKINDDSLTHLYGNWNDHFRAVLTSTTSLLQFDQIQLCTFSGHSGCIKKIITLDNENSFITASTDKTVKLWSTKNLVDVGTCQFNYDKHQKAVNDFVMLEHEGKIASTDGIVHIWDPFTNCTLQRLNWQDAGTELPVTTLSKLDRSQILMSSVATTMLTSFDIRSNSWKNSFAVNPPSEPCQGIKMFVVSPNGLLIASALANGCVSIVDLRMGKLLGYCTATEAEIVQIEWISDNSFVVISSDSNSKIFELTPPVKIVGKLTEPVSIAYAPSTKEYITIQASNKLRFYAHLEFRNEVKLRSDFISGSISAVNYLKFNQMFLIGSNTGMIRLAC